MPLGDLLRLLWRAWRNAGLTTTARWCLERLRAKIGTPSSPLLRLQPRAMAHPVYLRSGASSDPAVFQQIFFEAEYEILNTSPLATIIDLGANIGLASVYFLNKFPQARVLAVEPDTANFSLCRQNTAPYGSRVQLLLGAAWSHCGELTLSAGGDGREWGMTVQEDSSSHGVPVPCFDMTSLLDRAGFDVVDLLKIDIEGAELEIFRVGTEAWLPRVRNLCIELHGPACRTAFDQAMAAYEFDLSYSHELLVCRNIRRIGR